MTPETHISIRPTPIGSFIFVIVKANQVIASSSDFHRHEDVCQVVRELLKLGSATPVIDTTLEGRGKPFEV